ncbi:MAG: hypothetical protein ACMXX5_01135 [Candidatus Woesearchaeota archaeon]
MRNNWMHDLGDGFKILRDFVEQIIQNEHAMYVIILVVTTILFANILKMLLSKMPMFGEGGQVNKYGNVTAWCIAILGVLSIGWRLRGNAEDLITGLAGPYGILFIVAMSIYTGYGMYRVLENHAQTTRLLWGVTTGGALFIWWSSVIAGTPLRLGSIIIPFIIGLIVVKIMNRRR